ncbi:hypothetical protein BKG82_26345 [Mycobacteroides chelonae]|uniref:Uncharacterized protein n=1 Tax=Mycobacteroides chelonae TaxID=1774 RepID=A0A1S1LFT7_MYCCH|nr:hypothetical protein [Mycobacteroides chelonae]OHU47180.1 hypothetical protein BKG82_26345 [Mycobacteroides chelonae]
MTAAMAGVDAVAPNVLRRLDTDRARDGRVWRSRGGVLLRFFGQGWHWSTDRGRQWSLVGVEALTALTSGPYVEVPGGHEESSAFSTMGDGA